jgi:uncharacterized protein YaiE (UPF0345 family)
MMTLLLTCAVAMAACGGGGSGQPDSAAQAPAEPVCLVPDVVGQSQEAAESKISGSGLQMVSSSEFDLDVAEGSVISQDPAAGTRLEPCAGDVVIVVSLGPEPGSAAPETEPTAAEPTAIPSPTPNPYLFSDDFERGIKPEWGLTGSGFSSTNGKLVVNGSADSAIIGGPDWTNYHIMLRGTNLDNPANIRVRVRVQDRSNYMAFWYLEGAGTYRGGGWVKVVEGREEEVPGSKIRMSDGDMEIEVDGSLYRLLVNGEEKVRFADDTFSNGGFMLERFQKISLMRNRF